MKKLTIGPVLDMRGKPLKLPQRDGDGDTTPIPGTDAVVVVDGDTRLLLETLCYVTGIARAIQKPNDVFRISSIMAVLDDVKMVPDPDDADGPKVPEPGAEIKLKVKTYDWLIAKLKMKVPVTAEQKARDMAPLPFVQTVFPLHSNAVLEHLGADPIKPTDDDDGDED